MAKIVLFKKLKYEEVLAQTLSQVDQISEWFKNNPDRLTCNVEVCYGKLVEVKKDSIEKDLIAALDEIKNAGKFL